MTARETIRKILSVHIYEPHPDLVEAIRATLVAAIPDLVWRDSYGMHRAETPYGPYTIPSGNNILKLGCLPLSPEMPCLNLEAAKAAANAHHRATIAAAAGLLS